MQHDSVLIGIDGGVATITLNRPDVHNAFDEHVIESLTVKINALQANSYVHAVVLRGAGKSFSAGADLQWMQRAAGFTEQQNKGDALALAGLLQKLNTLKQVTIACVQGAAMGGGLGLAACCDIVIARDDASFALSEVRLGLIPATIAPYVLRAIGERQARRFFQTGERFRGDQAFVLGLVHEVAHSDSEMEAKLQTILDGLKNNGPQAMAAAKKLCRDLAGKEVTRDVLDDTAMRIAQTRSGKEAKEGVAAFLEKRKPVWPSGQS